MKNISEAEFILNLHQTSNGGEEIDGLLIEEEVLLRLLCLTIDTSSASKTKNNETFPEIHDFVTEFIKRNCYNVQDKRRNDDFVSCCVSVQDVRKHLLRTIHGLAEHGLSKTSVKPVHVGRISVKIYKGVFQGRITVGEKVTNILITFMRTLT